MKPCIECNKPARHWNQSYCEDCFRKILNEKLDEEEIKQSVVKDPHNSWR